MFKNLVMAAAVTMACAGSALAAPVLTVVKSCRLRNMYRIIN